MADTAVRIARQGPFALAPVALALADPATRFIFRGPPEAARLCGDAFGCALPMEACRAAERGSRAALWLGPDEWLLLGFDVPDAAQLGAAIDSAAASVSHSLVDVSHRQLGIDLEGPRAAEVLNAGCPLDLHLRACPVGLSTRTLMAKADVTLWRRGETRFRLEVNRSFAPYVMSFLRQADDARG